MANNGPFSAFLAKHFQKNPKSFLPTVKCPSLGATKKTLMNKFRKKIENINFGAKNDQFKIF